MIQITEPKAAALAALVNASKAWKQYQDVRCFAGPAEPSRSAEEAEVVRITVKAFLDPVERDLYEAIEQIGAVQ